MEAIRERGASRDAAILRRFEQATDHGRSRSRQRPDRSVTILSNMTMQQDGESCFPKPLSTNAVSPHYRMNRPRLLTVHLPAPVRARARQIRLGAKYRICTCLHILSVVGTVLRAYGSRRTDRRWDIPEHQQKTMKRVQISYT